MPEDLRRVGEERGALTEMEGRKPTEDEVLNAYLNSPSALLVLRLSVTPGHSWTSHLHSHSHLSEGQRGF